MESDKEQKNIINVPTKHGNEIYTVWDIDDEDDSIDRLFEVIELRTQNKC
jgi:predicted carbohydrate-binding protein with CBM5 and CBM33 domain